ncbi:hypothetical protein [Nocardia asiatica]|uniref:hypothetical protein n=1 Tax=Nocardia asiatica TaxID=209252 RepID=UPI002458B9AD|nr:hypothetical protein [Nocardia asiatica]
MNADEIRDQYIEVLARARYMRNLGYRSDQPNWEDNDLGFEAVRESYRKNTAPDVDALDAAGLLPTAYIETRGGYEAVNLLGEIVRRIPEEQRWMTEWREVES